MAFKKLGRKPAWPVRYSPQRQNPKPMDVPIISREAIRKNVARIALDEGCGIDAAITKYAETINFTEESLREIMEFVEEPQS